MKSSHFRNLYSKIKAENLFATLFTGGDYNGWPDGDTTPEGRVIENLFTALNLSQIMPEPRNFELGKKPFCIDLIVTVQPNLILDSWTRASLDSYCYHQIIHCKVNFRIPPVPPMERKLAILIEQIQLLFKRACPIFLGFNILILTMILTGEFSTKNKEIISLIRNLNPNKASGPDGISGQMLLLYDNSVVLPLEIIFQNILVNSTYPGMLKLANVTPIFQKGDKQSIKNYRQISLFQICGKIFEKIVFNNLYSYHTINNLISKNQSQTTTNQLLYLVNEIHEAFEDRTVFLEISKAFDKVWHEGLIFKLNQNGISGRLNTSLP